MNIAPFVSQKRFPQPDAAALSVEFFLFEGGGGICMRRKTKEQIFQPLLSKDPCL